MLSRKTKLLSFILLLVVLLNSCTTTEFFFDQPSKERQRDLKEHRSGNVFGDIGLVIASAFVMAAFDVDADLYPQGQEFKKIKLINPTGDTIYVNMLTDVFWDEENYCDFFDIRIPGNQNCKLLVPVNANYNVYFSNTPDESDDEMLEINTNEFRRLSLYPGLTVTNFKPNLNQ